MPLKKIIDKLCQNSSKFRPQHINGIINGERRDLRMRENGYKQNMDIGLGHP